MGVCLSVGRSLSVPVPPLGFSTTVVSSMGFGMHVLSVKVISTTYFPALQYDVGNDTASRRYGARSSKNVQLLLRKFYRI